MEIKVRNLASREYQEVVLRHGDITIDMGMLNRAERQALAQTLEEAVDDLVAGLDEDRVKGHVCHACDGTGIVK